MKPPLLLLGTTVAGAVLLAPAGCVSAPRRLLRRPVRRLDLDRAPVVAIGR